MLFAQVVNHSKENYGKSEAQFELMWNWQSSYKGRKDVIYKVIPILKLKLLNGNKVLELFLLWSFLQLLVAPRGRWTRTNAALTALQVQAMFANHPKKTSMIH